MMPATLRRLRRPAMFLLLATCAMPAAGADRWVLSTRQFDDGDYQRQAWVGNGYLSQRVPAEGMGYQGDMGPTGWPLETPRYTAAMVSGLYSRDAHNDEFAATLPTWSTLEFGDGTSHYAPASVDAKQIVRYSQQLDQLNGVLTTDVLWRAPSGHETDLHYDIFADRSRQHVAVVRLRFTPHWSGTAEIAGLIDGAGMRRMHAAGRSVDASRKLVRVDTVADGSGTQASTASAFALTSSAQAQAIEPADAASAGVRLRLHVQAGHSYQVIKYVGVATSRDSADARRTAEDAALAARKAGYPALLREHEQAWSRLWQARIDTPDNPELQSWIDASFYGLMSSVREGQTDSISPSGLSSDSYANQIYWDAETWMFPALLALHPELARPVVDYRYLTLDQAKRNATENGRAGAVYSWTTGPSGYCTGIGPCSGPYKQDHLQNEIALSQWQYYLATGDKAWLRARGWPVIEGIAQFWTQRAVREADGLYHVRNVKTADEYANGVDDNPMTNGGTVMALRDAIAAAGILGMPVPQQWRDIADHMAVPFDAARGIHPEYAGYDGRKIKQADTVLLSYPYDYPMPAAVAAADLAYYAPRTDLDGPAMTDSAHAVIAAQLHLPADRIWDYIERSVRPFVRAPYAQFSEARGAKSGEHDGPPAFSFLTGSGGFLQTMIYGLPGLRWSDGVLRLDPVWLPQAGRVHLRNLQWQGRRIDLELDPQGARATLVSGAAVTLATPQRQWPVRTGQTVTIPYR